MFYKGVSQNLAFSSRLGPKHLQKTPQRHPKSTLTFIQTSPGELPKHVSVKRTLSSSIFSAPDTKMASKREPRNLENRYRTGFCAARKTTDFLIPFYWIFSVLGIPRTSKIHLKHCTVVQNRRCQPLLKKTTQG